MVLDAIRKRRSIREYTPLPLTEEQVRLLLEAAMLAPSANDSRPWEFVVVRDEALRMQLARTHSWSGMAAQAPAVFVMLGDERRSPRHWVEDTSAATENLLVQAAAMGLGAVWVAVYPEQSREEYVRQALGIPAHLRVLCLVPVGHPASPKPPRDRFEEKRVHYDRY
jgi:nitroreductase